jgi:hypothetical protein
VRTYAVGYLVGSLASNSINGTLSKGKSPRGELVREKAVRA